MQTRNLLSLLLFILATAVTLGHAEVVTKAGKQYAVFPAKYFNDFDSLPAPEINISDEIDRLVELREDLTRARHDALLLTSREKTARADVEYLEECLNLKEELSEAEFEDVPLDTIEAIREEVRDLRVYVKRARRDHRWAVDAKKDALQRMAELEGMVIDLETYLLSHGIELPEDPTGHWQKDSRVAYQRLDRKNQDQDEEPDAAYTPIHQPSGLYLLRIRPPRDEAVPDGRSLMAQEILFYEKHMVNGTEMYLYGTAELKQIDDIYFLDLEVHMDSKRTADIYGKIERGSVMRVELENGDQLSLVNLIAREGTTNTEDGEFTFAARYLIDKSQLERLKAIPMDNIRLFWRGGFEDYKILTTEFFIQEMALLN